MKIPVDLQPAERAQRPVSTALTALGIGLVVAVFIGMLALANGFRAALARTGSTDNVLRPPEGRRLRAVERTRSRRASTSSRASPHIARGPDGRALASPRCTWWSRCRRMERYHPLANVVVRGVSAQAWQVRANVNSRGRSSCRGQIEIAVGQPTGGRFPNTGIGEQMHSRGGRGRSPVISPPPGRRSSRRSGERTNR